MALASAEPRSKEGDGLNCQCSPHGAEPSWSKQLWLHKEAAPKAELFSFPSSGTPGPGRGEGGIRSGTWFTFQKETLIESDLGLFISHYHPEPLSAFNFPGEPALSLQQGSGLTHSGPSDVRVSAWCGVGGGRGQFTASARCRESDHPSIPLLQACTSSLRTPSGLDAPCVPTTFLSLQLDWQILKVHLLDKLKIRILNTTYFPACDLVPVMKFLCTVYSWTFSFPRIFICLNTKAVYAFGKKCFFNMSVHRGQPVKLLIRFGVLTPTLQLSWSEF